MTRRARRRAGRPGAASRARSAAAPPSAGSGSSPPLGTGAGSRPAPCAGWPGSRRPGRREERGVDASGTTTSRTPVSSSRLIAAHMPLQGRRHTLHVHRTGTIGEGHHDLPTWRAHAPCGRIAVRRGERSGALVASRTCARPARRLNESTTPRSPSRRAGRLATGLEGPDFWQRVLVAEGRAILRYQRNLTVVVAELEGVLVMLRRGASTCGTRSAGRPSAAPHVAHLDYSTRIGLTRLASFSRDRRDRGDQ